jgi:uncharacterized membrane protein YhfC
MFAITVRTLNALLMIALPLLLGVYLYRRQGAEWRVFGIGVITMIAAQVFHIPFNNWVLNPMIEQISQPVLTPVRLGLVSLLLGLSAGVFEEVARYIAYRFHLIADRERTWSSALMFGAGHGGIESLVLGLLVVYGFIRLFAYKDANLDALVSADQVDLVRTQVDLFWSLPWYAAILGAVERAATLCFHMSAAVLVLQAFQRKNIAWLFAAIGWHTFLDALAVYASRMWSVYVAEVLIVGAGLMSLGIIFFLREKPFGPDDEIPGRVAERTVEFGMQEPSLDHLEDSRYV